VADGRELSYSQEDIHRRGWALECRILAEDPTQGFAPSTGRISMLRVPGGPGVRVDSGVSEGIVISPYYDSLLAKLIAWGETRAVAIVRMRRALDEYRIIGLKTNLDLHRALFDSHRFHGGQFYTRFLEEVFLPAEQSSDQDSEDHRAAALTAALVDYKRRGLSGTKNDETVSRWKMMGRYQMMRGWGE